VLCASSMVTPKQAAFRMSDDGYARYRKNDTYGRGGAQGSSPLGDDDPLAELARLIGQDQSETPPDWRTVAYEGYQYPQEQSPDPRYTSSAYPTHDPYQTAGNSGGPDSHYTAQSFDTHSDQHYQGEPYRQGGLDSVYDQTAHQDDRYFNDHGSDEDYEDSPPRRSRGGVVTIVAILCLAGLGTAGAFAYRAMFKGSASNSPPVIFADTTPNKIVPASEPSDNSSQSGSVRPDLGPAERMVSREEQPLNVQSTTSGSPAVAFSSSVPVTQPSPPANAQMALPPPSQQPTPGEPRRVRTVIIRPDQQGDSARVASNAAAFPTGSTRNVNPKTAAPAAAADPQGDAPLSLAPQGGPDSSPSHKLASASTRQVQAPPVTAAAGGFFVQIAAQKSEEDAQVTFRTMQAKYPEQLGGRQPVIRRKDLDKGTFFGVQVGPFASREDAVQLCESLKSAGGACMIQKN
jgi:hypothetical protein